MTNDLLWPRYDSPDNLIVIERIPLADRGLPATTYEVLLRAATYSRIAWLSLISRTPIGG